MTDLSCDTVRDLLPDLGTGGLGGQEEEALQGHLAHCPDCRRELEILAALREARPEPPSGLDARIQARIKEELPNLGQRVEPSVPGKDRSVRPLFGRTRRVPAWALSAAAMLVLALGTSRLWLPGSTDSVQDPIVVANQDPLPEEWLWDDGMVAGGPVFDGLSDEELETLLQELEG